MSKICEIGFYGKILKSDYKYSNIWFSISAKWSHWAIEKVKSY